MYVNYLKKCFKKELKIETLKKKKGTRDEKCWSTKEWHTVTDFSRVKCSLKIIE